MIDALARDLARIGFSDKEARVYIALLRLGSGGAQEAADAAGVNRASTYDVLETLVKRGLVTPILESGQRRFMAEPAERVLSIVHAQRRELEGRLIEAEALYPKLAAFQRLGGAKPCVRYVEGVDGLRSLQREYEAQSGDIIQLVGYDAFLALHDPRATREHRDVMGERHLRAIAITEREVDFSRYAGLEVRVVPPTFVSAAGEMTVCGDRVSLFSYTQGIIAIEIQSVAIADTCRATLELAWREAGRLAATLAGKTVDETADSYRD